MTPLIVRSVGWESWQTPIENVCIDSIDALHQVIFDPCGDMCVGDNIYHKTIHLGSTLCPVALVRVTRENPHSNPRLSCHNLDNFIHST